MNGLLFATDLASSIRAEHEAAQAAALSAVAHAIRAGELLIEAKAALPHGEFGAWLAVNVSFSERTAQGYMKLARLSAEKRNGVADLSLRDALATLTAPKERPPLWASDAEKPLWALVANGRKAPRSKSAGPAPAPEQLPLAAAIRMFHRDHLRPLDADERAVLEQKILQTWHRLDAEADLPSDSDADQNGDLFEAAA